MSLFCPPSACSILAEAKNLSFNATAAFKAYSNIKANVDEAEKEAKAAKQRASEAVTLVSGHTNTLRNTSTYPNYLTIFLTQNCFFCYIHISKKVFFSSCQNHIAHLSSYPRPPVSLLSNCK